jgi:hypothetical protein
VQKQIMVMLVDSSSSTTFISEHMVQKLALPTHSCSLVTVKVVNGASMNCNQMVKNVEWWANGHLYHTDMRVLPISAFDAILGYDWLQNHSSMECDWKANILSFMDENVLVVFKGDEGEDSMMLHQISVSQLHKWEKANEVWTFVLVETCVEQQTHIQHADMHCVLIEFRDLFTVPNQLPPSRVYVHYIPLLPGVVPVNSRPYRYSPFHKDEIERQVNALLEAGLITPSVSPFSYPVLLVKKKDGSWRFCVDYRKLNDMTVKNRFPMSLVEEILDELASTHFFTSLELTAEYHQIRMGETDEFKTTFKTHQGHYQFRVMPFGLTNVPATFQCAMNSVLAPFLRKFVLVFIDDILIYSASWVGHLKHLRMVFEKLREHQFYLKRSKCAFGETELLYLGHIISQDGVSTDPSKTDAMKKWPTPTSVTELRVFWGLTGYYRRFVKHYSIIAKPLTNLLKHKAFHWSPEADAAFQ